MGTGRSSICALRLALVPAPPCFRQNDQIKALHGNHRKQYARRRVLISDDWSSRARCGLVRILHHKKASDRCSDRRCCHRRLDRVAQSGRASIRAGLCGDNIRSIAIPNDDRLNITPSSETKRRVCKGELNRPESIMMRGPPSGIPRAARAFNLAYSCDAQKIVRGRVAPGLAQCKSRCTLGSASYALRYSLLSAWKCSRFGRDNWSAREHRHDFPTDRNG